MICRKDGTVVPTETMHARREEGYCDCRSSSSREASGVVVQNHFEGVSEVFSTAFMAKALRLSQTSF